MILRQLVIAYRYCLLKLSRYRASLLMANLIIDDMSTRRSVQNQLRRKIERTGLVAIHGSSAGP